MNYPNYVKEELPEISRKLLSNFSQIKVWCFYAEMGAGKTTLIKQICKELGVIDEMSSPTFSIVNEYKSLKMGMIYHFDFYRLTEMKEAINIGVEEYLYSGNFCLLEWPGLVEPLLPEEYLEININLVSDNARSLMALPK
ncbi:MAG: tRNA (adenosine(37)-N6)-threonylcarbamoyltransferase complex ATPase subunit type 1 TsaE [Bacteroidota bacterium]